MQKQGKVQEAEQDVVAAGLPIHSWQPGQFPVGQWHPDYRMGDSECGALTNYADDSSASASDRDVTELATSIHGCGLILDLLSSSGQ